jgi:hypothetical protein
VANRPKRTAVTLDAKTDATLAKLAMLQRRPKAAIAADLLTEMQPALERITALLEVAMRNRERLPSDTAQRLQSLEELLGHTAAFGLERLEAAVTPPAASEPARRRSAGRRGRGH